MRVSRRGGAYVDTGDADGGLARVGIDFPDPIDFEATFNAFAFSMIGMLPVSDSAGMFGKLGYFDREMELDLSPLVLTDNIEESGITAGVGIRWESTNNLALRSEIDRYETGIDTLWTIGVGVQYSLDN